MSRADQTDPYSLPADPDLHDLFVAWARSIALSTRTATVGSITAYNPADQTAAVTVDILEVARVVGTTAAAPRPPLRLPKVPVHFYGDGTGECYMSMPLKPGSTGMLIVSDRSLAAWLGRPGPAPVDPVEWFTHRFASAVFVPGLTDNAHRIATPTALDGPVLEGPTIHLGRESVLSVAVAEHLITAVDAMLAALVTAGAGNAFTGAGTAQAAWDLAKEAIASVKVKVI